MNARNIQELRSVRAVREFVQAEQAKGLKLGLVPTMGSLHAGHLSLVDRAQQESDVVIASIFVNPAQFNDPKDLEAYPRDLETDLELFAKSGVKAVFFPSVEEIYGPDFQSWITPSGIGEILEEQNRPGHFRGVATVVAALFNIAQPDIAVFGEKDFQQLRVIERMVEELKFPVRIVRGALVREKDGLALSSRNVRLSAEDRKTACLISEGLTAALELFQGGETVADKLTAQVTERLSAESDVSIDYVVLVDEVNLGQLDQVRDSACRILVAATVGEVRLIDNIALVS